MDDTNTKLNPEPMSTISMQTIIDKTLIVPRTRNKCCLVLSESSKLHFIGIIKVRVLYGNVKIMGRIIYSDGNFHRLYSSNTHPIVINQFKRISEDLDENKQETLEEFLFAKRTQNNFILTNQILEMILVAISEFDLNWVTLIEVESVPNITTLLPISRFQSLFIPHRISETLPNFYQLQTPKSLLTDNHTEVWERIMSIPIFHMTTIICGPKNAGKSTFSLYAINYLLESHKQVVYLECDPGQPEFLPNGVLGFHILKNGIIGPSYTHKFQPQNAYLFGSNTPIFNPERYILIIRCLWLEIQNNFSELPVIVNTCGWINGLGINLLADLFSITRPTCIIALYTDSSRMWTRGLSSVLMEPLRCFTKDTEAALKLTLFHNIDHLNTNDPNISRKEFCHIFPIKSFLNEISKKEISLSPTDFRCLNLVRYFIPQIHPNTANKATPHKKYYLRDILLKCPVYEVSMDSFFYQKIYQNFVSSSILDVINGSLISLGITNETDSVQLESIMSGINEFKFLPLSCLVTYIGLGIVRCISEKLRKLYICTPISFSRLTDANTIMVGSSNLFEPLYCLKEKREGSLYLSEKSKLLTKGNKIRKAKKYLKHKIILKRRRSLLSIK